LCNTVVRRNHKSTGKLYCIYLIFLSSDFYIVGWPEGRLRSNQITLSSDECTMLLYCYCSVTKTELAAHTETLLTNLFVAMTKEGSQENEYVMKG